MDELKCNDCGKAIKPEDGYYQHAVTRCQECGDRIQETTNFYL
jgi:DNA-directed RNA polymerase subunit RPC12/RpoP